MLQPGDRPCRKKQKPKTSQTHNSDTVKRESDHSDEEEEYTYCLRTVAPKFQPIRQVTETVKVQQQCIPPPVVVLVWVPTPVPAKAQPAEESQ